MKRIFPLLVVIMFSAGLVLTSCNTSSRLCPAYPPSVYQGDVLQNDDARTVIELIDIEDNNL